MATKELKPWEEEISEEEKLKRIEKQRREIDELKAWELSLSDEDKIKRDEYKFNVVTGKYIDPLTGEEFDYCGPLVGYPSIDKPQLQHYDREKYFEEKVKRTVTDQLFTSNKENLLYTAIDFLGNEIKFHELFNNIKDLVRSLSRLGVGEGSYVTLCLTSIPEATYSFYAMGYLGSVGIFIPPYVDTKKMVSDINANNSKVLIVMDVLYDKIKKKLKNTTIEKIIIVPTLNSAAPSIKQVANHISAKAKVKNRKKEILWNDFIAAGKDYPMPEMVPYKKDRPISVVYSSGTSGNIKGILLSHDSYQNSVLSYPVIGVSLRKGQKLYHVIPDWTSTGTSTCMHLPLVYGSCVFIDPRYNADVFAENISKNNINYVIGKTSLFEGFTKEENIQDRKFSDLRYPYVVGTPITNKLIKKIEKIYNEHGCFVGILIAYGSCENGAAISTETPATGHKPGSVGVILPGINVMIVDDDGNELPYGQRGHIMVLSPCRMIKYHNNDKLTEEYWFVDKNDLKWSKTGDIGYVGTDGILYYCGRANDYSVINNEKIYNFDIKKIIMEDGLVTDCEVVSKEIDNENYLCAHIIFEDGIYNFKKSELIIRKRITAIQERLYEEYQNNNMVPEYIKIRLEFPTARSTKRDMPAIKKENKGFVHLEFEKGKQKKLVG